tara:strand:- start:835 stop:1023 length:189 start_codon:yes stop_codon:yes gene_type:complete
MIDRNDVISEVYRSLRDALNNIRFVSREKNKIVYMKDNKKISITFKIKIEELEPSGWDEVMP